MIKKIFILFFLSFSSIIYAENIYHCYKDWQEISSKNFIVVFPEKFKDTAKQVLKIAENVHYLNALKFPYITQRKTWIIISDHSDEFNGWATTLPVKKIQLYLQPPESRGVFDTAGDNLQLLLSHEYTHILNMDQAIGIWRFLGISPNWLLPVWMTEGLAVWHETSFTSKGRGKSPWIDSFFRTDFIYNQNKSLSDLCVFPVKWPSGNIPYCYGWSFYDFLSSKFSEDKIHELHWRNIFRLPYFHKGLAKKVFGKTMPELFEEYLLYMKQNYQKKISTFEKEGPVSFYSISLPAVDNRSYLRTYNGMLYFYENSANSLSSIKRFNPQTGELKDVLKDISIKGFCISSDGIFWAGERIVANSSIIYSLFSSKLDGKKKRLLLKERIFNPFFVSSGKLLFLSRVNFDSVVVKELDLYSKKTSVVFTPLKDLLIVEAAGDKDRLWFLMRDSNGYNNIYYLDRVSSNFIRVTKDSSPKCGLFYDQKTERLFFSASLEGIYQIFSVRYTNFKFIFERHVRIKEGAVDPCLVGNVIFFNSFHSDGMALCNTPFVSIDVVKWPEEEIKKTKSFNNVDYKSSKYNYIRPFISSLYLFPAIYSVDSSLHLGLQIFGNDLFDNFYFNAKLFTPVTVYNFTPEYEINLSWKHYFLQSGLSFSDKYSISIENSLPVFAQSFDIFGGVFFQKRLFSLDVLCGLMRYNESTSPVSIVDFYQNSHNLLYNQLVLSSLRATKRAVQYEKGFAFSEGIGFGLDEYFINSSFTRFDHYWHLEKHFVFSGKHEFLYLWMKNNNTLKFSHTFSLDLPLLWIERGYQQIPLYLHYLSLTLNCGILKDMYPSYLLFGRVDTLFDPPSGLHFFGGIDFNTTFTFIYHLPLKLKMGVVAGSFGIVPNLGVEVGLYFNYNNNRYFNYITDRLKLRIKRN